MTIERLRKIRDSLEDMASGKDSELVSKAHLIFEGAKILHNLHITDSTQIKNNPELKRLEIYFLDELNKYKKESKFSYGRSLLTGRGMFGYTK